MGQNLGSVIFGSVAGEAFWELHLLVDAQVVVVVLCEMDKRSVINEYGKISS